MVRAAAVKFDVAFTLGYERPSAFIAMFHRSFGTTPARYFEGAA